MPQFDWKNISVVAVLEILAVAAVLIKITYSPLDFASAAMLVPVTALYIAKVVIHDAKIRLEEQLKDLKETVYKHRAAIEMLDSNNKEVVKMAEETKSVLSKLNLTAAFAGRTARSQG